MSDDARLETVLASLPQAIDWPTESPHLPSRVVAVLEPGPTTSRRLPRWAPVVALLAGVVLVVGIFPGPRQVAADILAEAGVRIGFIEEPATVPGGGLNLGESLSLDEAAQRVEFTVRVPADSLGEPDAVYLDAGIVSMVWSGSPHLPAAGDTGVGVLLTQSITDIEYAQKGIGPDTEVMPVQVEGGLGLWIEGADHSFVLLDEQGAPISVTARLAANVLLWEFEGVDHRLELNGGLDRALEIVESMQQR